MGGGWYDREVTSTESTYSTAATTALSQKGLHPDLNPYQRSVKCGSDQFPIVVAIDVTGSMSNWPKIMWDKMPMFYGQILMKNYATNPTLSFCAIGDAISDKAPLQVCQFAQGTDIDTWISKIFLEGGGGPGSYESYELAAFYYSHMFSWEGQPEPDYEGTYHGKKGYFILTGDEHFYPTIKGSQVKSLFF